MAEKLFFFFLSFLLLYSFLYFSFFFLLSFLIFLLWKLLKNSFVRNAFSHYLFFFLPPLFFILMKNKTLLSIGSFPISFSLFLHISTGWEYFPHFSNLPRSLYRLVLCHLEPSKCFSTTFIQNLVASSYVFFNNPFFVGKPIVTIKYYIRKESERRSSLPQINHYKIEILLHDYGETSVAYYLIRK